MKPARTSLIIAVALAVATGLSGRVMAQSEAEVASPATGSGQPWIAYDWNLPSSISQIAVTDLDGSDERTLLPCDGPCYGNGGPAWSPDGRYIGFDGAEGPTDEHAGDRCYLALLDLETGAVPRFNEHAGCEVSDAYLQERPVTRTAKGDLRCRDHHRS